ncbi:beta-galactosidase-1-like protein 2 [Anoplophora glabripennis]|uniref:beta-galactosidase-1-like protein 2 n=1 Tax=Anoplophora glabripennis TaxID=217634 RepID=UPI000874E805|nr:beta-galactosidase-1-like protein 2 [Anoplophora glabripennis]
MALAVTLILTVCFLLFVNSGSLPTNYEYFTSDGISSGLSVDQPYFTLNGKNFSVYSGAMHYFRVPRGHWRDRMKKMRAAGLNTIETYVAWNLHEPYSGVYDFGDGGTEMEDFLHIEELLQTAQEEDLFVILRPGPYICAEYNYGGFPAWLLREKTIGFRTNEANYLKYVKRFFEKLFAVVNKHQFTKGGSVIAFQIENEYGFAAYKDFVPERAYLQSLYQIFLDNDVVELLITSDSPSVEGDEGTVDGVFQATNLGTDPEEQFNKILKRQPNKPLLAMEYWVGWFDFWTGVHHTTETGTVLEVLRRILEFPASFNIYMFIGGTNWGFTNGASLGADSFNNSEFMPVTTSYDYDSVLTEAGDYTDKYTVVKKLIEQYSTIPTNTPAVPNLQPKIAYPTITVQKRLSFSDIIDKNAPYVINSPNVVAMELLDINNGSGQSVGYIVYRKENVDLAAETVLMIEGHICDTAVVLVNGVLVSPVLKSVSDIDGFGYWRLENSTLLLNSNPISNATIDIVVEEWGRMNGGNIYQYNKTFKGLWQGDVYLNEDKISDWKIIPLEFKKEWTNNLQGWSDKTSNDGTALFYAALEISDEPQDTFLDMRKWTKGLVIVNGFPLGKYLMLGPQQTLYLPGPFLRKGTNDIVIFEHFKANDEVSFALKQIWTVPDTVQ